VLHEQEIPGQEMEVDGECVCRWAATAVTVQSFNDDTPHTDQCIREKDNKDELIEPKGFSSAERKREICMHHFLSCFRTAKRRCEHGTDKDAFDKGLIKVALSTLSAPRSGCFKDILECGRKGSSQCHVDAEFDSLVQPFTALSTFLPETKVLLKAPHVSAA